MMGDPNMEIILDESLRNQTVATTNVNSMKYFTREANGEEKQRFISLDEIQIDKHSPLNEVASEEKLSNAMEYVEKYSNDTSTNNASISSNVSMVEDSVSYKNFRNESFINETEDVIVYEKKSLNESTQITSIVSSPELLVNNSAQNSTDRIPRRIIILDTRYKSISEIPDLLQENILNTINIYHNAWDAAGLKHEEVWYLGNTECQEQIKVAEPRLLQYYLREQKGQYKANVCRIAALFNKGGYYFDTDMQVVKAVTDISTSTTFVSPLEVLGKEGKINGIFNSFVAASAKHPIFKINFDLFLEFYQTRHRRYSLLGTKSLFEAYEKFLSSPQISSKEWPIDMSLAEIHLKSNAKYIEFPRHGGQGCCCDYVVHNRTQEQIYFYSRILGVDYCRFPTPKK